MQPIRDVREISRIAYGFMASQALFAALELDVFSFLSKKSADLSDIAIHSDVAPNRMLTLLTTLVSIGLLEKRDDVYFNAPASEAFLVADSPKFYGDYLRVVNGKFAYSSLSNLGNTLRQNSGKGFYSEWYSDPVNAAEFSRAQHTGSLGPANLLARHVNLSNYHRLLDVGGGSGAFTITLSQHNPQLTATILDFPQTIEVARHYVAEAGLNDRVSFIEGSALQADWQSGYDLILMSYIWSAVGDQNIIELVERAYAALAPGGLLLIHDFMVNDDLTAPPIAAWHLLLSSVDNSQGVCLNPSLVNQYLSQGGFENVTVDNLIPGITSLAKAHKLAG